MHRAACWILLPLALVCGSSFAFADEPAKWPAEAKVALDRGVKWLVSKQAKEDGGWHSTTYGSLKDGAAVTTLSVYTLSRLTSKEDRAAQRPAVDRGLAFLEIGRKARAGPIASPDGSFDYPTYATAMWITTRRNLGIKREEEDTLALIWLVSAQLAEARGFEPAHPGYGGWDLLGVDDATAITTGSNVSVTLFALEALEPYEENAAVLAKKRAVKWLERCRAQGNGGGFAFTPETAEHQHKAGMTSDKPPRAVSYGTTTADGLQAMLFAGVEADNEMFRAPLSWLEKRSAVEAVPGFEDLSPEIGWQRGLRFYYAQSLASVIPQLPEPARTQRRNALAQSLIKSQQMDGSWKNESARMREDDPLISTAFVILALQRLIDQQK